MSERKIITEFVHPPIPVRQFDWSATRDGWDEGEPIGWGKTEDEAIADLLEMEAEHEGTVSTTDLLRSMFAPFGVKA